METYWNRINVKELLEADFFEHNLKIYLDENDQHPVEVNPRIYYDKLFAPPKGNSNYFSLINSIKEARDSMVYFVEGFAGCGKSTIVNKVFWDLTKKENKRKFDYSDFNYKLSSSRYNYNIGANTCPTNTDEVVSLIREGLAERISKILTEDIEDLSVYDIFTRLANAKNITNIDKSRTIHKKLVGAAIIKKEIKRINKKRNLGSGNIQQIIRDQLLEFNTQLLLAADFLWRLAQYLHTGEESYLFVAYDNLDAIDSPEVLEEFDDDLIAFIKNINTFIENECNNLRQQFSIIQKPKFDILVTYRKITAARVNLKNIRHEVVTEDEKQYVFNIDVSDCFDYCEIVKKKYLYFKGEVEKRKIKPPVFEQLEQIYNLNETEIIYKNYKAFWNHNFRGCAQIMQAIVDDPKTEKYINEILLLIKEHCDSVNQKEDLNVYIFTGASSIFLRVICDLFSRSNVFGEQCLNLLKLNENSEQGYTTLSRLILNYYHSMGKVSVNELFKVFEGIYQPAEIAVELSHLLDKNNMWRRPLYYTKYALTNYQLVQQLMTQVSEYNKGDMMFTNYTELELCPCGKLYIEMLVTSFEFFACRCLPNSCSLYSKQKIEDMFLLIDNVYKSVKNCCENLKLFREKYMEVKRIGLNAFLELPFNSRTRNGNSQLHEERIIFSHINYLELYRQYILHKTEGDKREINKMLVDSIINYLILYQKYILKIDPQRKEVEKVLMDKAISIRNKDYTDYTTKIERNRVL